MSASYVFASESVTWGHPDKLCDRISDALVGHVLRQDPLARIDAECAVATGIVFIAASMATDAAIDVPHVARDVIARTGYDRESFDPRACTVMTTISELDPHLRLAVDERSMDRAAIDEVVAEEPITVFGFACDQTPALMPLPIWLSHRLAHRLGDLQRTGTHPWLGPDGKTQVAVEFAGDRPLRIQGITVTATRTKAPVPSLHGVREILLEDVVRAVFADEPIRPDERTTLALNPRGEPLPGGPASHSGLTGRKTGDDTYGEFARHSGSALSGKDPSRVERVAAYAARHAALNVVAAGLARSCEVMLSYAPGEAQPVSVNVETFGTQVIDESEITRRVTGSLDFRPASVVARLGLRDLARSSADGFWPQLAAYGHMGRLDLDVPWERADAAQALR